MIPRPYCPSTERRPRVVIARVPIGEDNRDNWGQLWYPGAMVWEVRFAPASGAVNSQPASGAVNSQPASGAGNTSATSVILTAASIHEVRAAVRERCPSARFIRASSLQE